MTAYEAASLYLTMGWWVFPCHWVEGPENAAQGVCSCGQADCGSPGKHPRPRKGVLDASASPDQISGWFRRTWPDANIGVACGNQSGIHVVDLDGPAGIGEWDALELIHGESPTLMARTGSGGIHRYYAVPPTLKLGNTAKKIAPHVDSRGNGGYVLAPPSNHASGGRYAWLNAVKPAPLPDWVVSMIQRKKPSSDARLDRPSYRADQDDPVGLRIVREECEAVASTQPGARNHALFKAAASLGSLAAGGDLQYATVVDALRYAAQQCGLGLAEADRTIQSGFDTGMENPRVIRTRIEQRKAS